MMTRLTSRAERIAARFIPKGAKLVPGPAGCAAYRWETAGRFYAMGFRGSAAAAEFHYAFKTAEHLEAYVAEFFESVKRAAAYKAEKRATKKAWANPAKVGDILYSSWGYDQTNVEFYAVTKVSGKRVWVREIASDYEATGFMSGKTWPVMPIRYVGEETMHTAQMSGEKGYAVKISNSITAWLETGREHHTSSYA